MINSYLQAKAEDVYEAYRAGLLPWEDLPEAERRPWLAIASKVTGIPLAYRPRPLRADALDDNPENGNGSAEH